MCSLEANWVSAGFAAPREAQEEPQEVGSQSKVERADPRGGTDRAKQMTALSNAIDSLSIVEEAEVCGKKRWGWKAGKESTHLVGFVMQVISPGRAYECIRNII